ncbi:hypothetical protein MAR_016648, partial [Mya arenaria]
HRTFRDSQNSNAGLPLNEGYQYYPRYYPSWSWGGSEQTYNMAANTGIEGGRFYQVSEDGKRYEYPGMAAYDNVGAFGGRPSKGGSYKLKPPSDMSDGTTSFGSPAGRRRCCVVMSIVGLFLLVAAGVAIGIYFGVVDKPGNEQQTSTMSPVAAKSIQLTMAVEGTYSSALDDPASPEYQAKEQAVIKEVDEAMADTQMANSYIGFRVDGFSNGSIIVHGQAEFQAATYRNIDGTGGSVALGESCASRSDCSVVQAECTGNPSVCTCKSTHFDNNGGLSQGVCLIKKGYGTSCTAKTNCATVDSICSQTAGCSCPENKFYKADTDSCVLKLDFGAGDCTDASKQCSTSNAICTVNKCACENANFLKDGVCVPKITHGNSGCNTNTNCKTGSATCALGTCSCSGNKYYDSNSDNCAPKIVNGLPCESRDMCLFSNASCIETKCSCTDSQYELGSACLDKVQNGEACSMDRACIITNAQCLEMACTCDSTRFLQGLACVEKKGQGESCTGKVQCLGTGTVCAANLCDCPSGQFFHTDTQTCIDKYEIGVECQNTMQCLPIDSECSQNEDSTKTVCQCPASKYLVGTACLDRLDLGETCDISGPEKQCLYSLSQCSGTQPTCQCPDSMYANAGTKTCIPKKGLEGSCAAVEECLYSSAECTEGKCQCGRVDQGSSCTDALQCKVGGASCLGDVCACTDTQFLDEANNRCADKITDGACDSADMCLHENAECVSFQCTCPADRYLDEDNKACALKKAYGLNCDTAEQCATENAACSGTCTCNDDSFHDTSDGADVCTQKRGDNEACDNAAQCLRGNSECDQVCGCPGNMYMDDSTSPPQCSNKLAYEAVCTSEVQCITSAALCVAMETASQCMCSANYFHDSTNDKCTFKKANGVVCGTVGECSVTNSVCSSTCQCPEGTFLNGSQCSNKLMNGEACTDTLQCRVQSADCDGTCQCDALRYLDVKTHSEFCESAEQCSTGACDNHQCSCLDGQYYSTAEGACKDRIGDGGICANDDECSYTNAACVETQCTCGAGYYVNHTGLACEQKKLNGEACGVMEECLVTSAQCLSSACSCSQDQYLENLECRAIITTTPIPTTPAPDEIVFVDVDGEVTFNQTYDPALNDTTSETFQNYASDFQTALIDSDPSIEIAINVTDGGNQEPADVDALIDLEQQIKAKVTRTLLKVLQEDFTEKIKNSTYFRNLEPPKETAVKVKEGNNYRFEPIEPVDIERPCHDLTNMKIAATIACREHMQAISNSKEPCSFVDPLFNCTLTELVRMYRNSSDTAMCPEGNPSRNFMVTALIKHQNDLFKGKSVNLETCEFFLVPNMQYHTRAKCEYNTESLCDSNYTDIHELGRIWCGSQLYEHFRYYYEVLRRDSAGADVHLLNCRYLRLIEQCVKRVSAHYMQNCTNVCLSTANIDRCLDIELLMKANNYQNVCMVAELTIQCMTSTLQMECLPRTVLTNFLISMLEEAQSRNEVMGLEGFVNIIQQCPEEPMMEKPGTCPIYAFDANLGSGCCDDTSCSGTRKCCQIGDTMYNGMNSCVEPANVTLCNDTEAVMSVMPVCNLTQEAVASLTCESLIRNASCMAEYNVTVYFNNEIMNDTAARKKRQIPDSHICNQQLVDQYMPIIISKMTFGDGATSAHYRTMWCNNAFIYLTFSLYTDIQEHEIYNLLQPLFSTYNNPDLPMYHEIVSCVGIKTREPGEDCSFYDVQRYVYNQLRWQPTGNNLPIYDESYSIRDYCRAYQPVCSAEYIMDARYSDCYGNYWDYYQNDCKNSLDRDHVKKFMKCAKTRAVLRGETDCTIEALRDLIKSDSLNLGLTKRGVDFDTCINEYLTEAAYTSCFRPAFYENRMAAFNCVNLTDSARHVLDADDPTLCRMREYSVRCLGNLATDAGVQCSTQDLTQALTDSMGILETIQRIADCRTFEASDVFGTCPDITTVTDNSCTDKTFISDIAVAVCLPQLQQWYMYNNTDTMYNNTGMQNNNTMMQNGTSQNGTMQNATIQNGTRQDRTFNASCIKQQYMYQCVDGALYRQNNMKPCGAENINSAIRVATGGKFNGCPDDGEEKPGFCPVMDRCNMHYGPDSVVNMCTKDSHCYDGDKCCHDGCRLRCMKTAYEQALFEIIQMFEILDLYSLTYNFSSVRKSLAGTTDVFFSVKTFHLLTLFDLTRAMKRITENDNEVILSYVQILSEKTRGQCPASSNVYPYETLCDNDYHCRYQFQADDYKCCYDNGMRCLHTENETQSKCSSMYDLYEVTRGYCQEERNLFLQNLEQHSWAACGVVQRFTSCMTDMLKIVWPDCVNAPDMFLYGLHQYVDIIKEKEDKWELHVMVDFQACRALVCFTPNLPRYIQDDSLDFESLVFCIMLYGTEQETCFAQTLVPMVMRALSHINSTLRNPEPMCSDVCNFTWTPMSQPAENRITINMTVHPRRNTTVVSTFIPALSSGIDMNSAGKWIGIGVNPEKQMTGTDAFTIENMDGMTFKVNNSVYEQFYGCYGSHYEFSSQNQCQIEDYTEVAMEMVRLYQMISVSQIPNFTIPAQNINFAGCQSENLTVVLPDPCDDGSALLDRMSVVCLGPISQSFKMMNYPPGCHMLPSVMECMASYNHCWDRESKEEQDARFCDLLNVRDEDPCAEAGFVKMMQCIMVAGDACAYRDCVVKKALPQCGTEGVIEAVEQEYMLHRGEQMPQCDASNCLVSYNNTVQTWYAYTVKYYYMVQLKFFNEIRRQLDSSLAICRDQLDVFMTRLKEDWDAASQQAGHEPCDFAVEPCSSSYFEVATTEACKPFYEKYLNQMDCGSYELFLGCINVQSYGYHNRTCGIRKIHMFSNSSLTEADTMYGGSNDVRIIDIRSENGKTQVVVERPANATDMYDLGLQGTMSLTLGYAPIDGPYTLLEASQIDTSFYDVFSMLDNNFPMHPENLCDNEYILSAMLETLCLIDDYYEEGASNQTIVWTQAMKCAYGTMMATDYSFTTSCSLESQFKPALVALAHMSTENSEPGPAHDVDYFNQCASSQENIFDSCPTKDELLYTTVAACGLGVLSSGEQYQYQCRYLRGCTDAIKGAYMTYCPQIDDLVDAGWQNLTYANYIESVIGFNPSSCGDEPRKCDDACPEIFKPVCAIHMDSDMMMTFDNQCFLDIANCQEGNRWMFKSDHACDYMAMYMKVMEEDCEQWLERFKNTDNCGSYEGLLGCINTNILTETMMKCRFSDISRSIQQHVYIKTGFMPHACK